MKAIQVYDIRKDCKTFQDGDKVFTRPLDAKTEGEPKYLIYDIQTDSMKEAGPNFRAHVDRADVNAGEEPCSTKTPQTESAKS